MTENVAGSSPCRSGERIFFSRVNILRRKLFRYQFHPRVTAVAHKRSRSFRLKRACGRLQLNTHTPYIRVFERSDTVDWCIVVWCTENVRRDGSSFT